MITIHTAIAWCMANPGTCVLILTYLQAVLHTLAVEQGWHWAEVASKVIAALPAFNLAGLASAGKKKP